MKKLLLTVIIAFTLQNVMSQNAYYDALFLNTLSDAGLDRILDAGTTGQIYLSPDEILQIGFTKDFISDPFDLNTSITGVFDIGPVKNAMAKYNQLIDLEYTLGIGTPSGIIPGGGGAVAALGLVGNAVAGDFSLDKETQTNIIDGLTKYYAEEFKKAQLLTYMNTFENTIGEIGELQVLFPNTFNKLKNTNPSRFPDLGNEYKEIFNQDLIALIDNLILHIENHQSSDQPLEGKLKFLNYNNLTAIKTSENYKSLELSADISSKLINNYHPVDLFSYLDAVYYKDSYLSNANTIDQKLSVLIHGINLIQRNLLDTTKTVTNQFSNVWLSYEELNKINTKKEWEYFAGLLYQQDKDYFKKIFFTPAIPNITNQQIQDIKDTYARTLSFLHRIQEHRNNLSEADLKNTYIEYMDMFVSLISDITTIDSFDNASLDYDISKFIRMYNYSIQVYDNARSKDYSNSIHYLTLILNEFDSFKSNPSYVEIMQQIDLYGAFMTDVINSTDSDEVKEVIKEHAAPPASFILKREFASTFSITGQPGYFISGEYLDDDLRFVSGITLPMGFEYSLKTSRGPNNSASIGLFAQVVDLGAVLNFRVNDPNSTLPEKIEFSQIFSPGFSINYGFKNSPLTLGVGYQYSPELREVSLENGNTEYQNGHRILLRLAWDIPLVNIWKSSTR